MEKVLPWEPPTTLIYYDSPTKTQLNINQAATSVANTLTSMIVEMQDAMRALGKSSLKELSPDDLVALDSFTAEVTGVKQVLGLSHKQSIPKNLHKTQTISLAAEQINSLHGLNLLLYHAHRLVNLQDKVVMILRAGKLTENLEAIKTEYEHL